MPDLGVSTNLIFPSMFNKTDSCHRWTLTGAAFLLTVGLIIATAIASNTIYKIKNTNVISVTGSVEKLITSDTVKWRSSFTREVSKEELTSGTNQLKTDLETVKKYFLSQGIKENEIIIDPMTTSEKREYVCERQLGPSDEKCSDRFVGYYLGQNLTIESKNVQGIAKLALEAPVSLIQQGILFNSMSPEYYYSYEKLKEIKAQLLASASTDAKNRAETIAKNAGSHLGTLQSATMGIFQITPVNSTDFADYGIYDTTTIDKKISGILRAKFLLK